MAKHYEVHTFTLAEGYVNCWLDGNDNPITYSTHAAAMRDLKHYFADCEAALQDGEIYDYESDLIIVEVNDE
jgi:hypothetical protein